MKQSHKSFEPTVRKGNRRKAPRFLNDFPLLSQGLFFWSTIPADFRGKLRAA
jgi:hypothetical protein